MAFNELVLPQKIQLDEKTASDRYAKFTAEPYAILCAVFYFPVWKVLR